MVINRLGKIFNQTKYEVARLQKILPMLVRLGLSELSDWCTRIWNRLESPSPVKYPASKQARHRQKTASEQGKKRVQGKAKSRLATPTLRRKRAKIKKER